MKKISVFAAAIFMATGVSAGQLLLEGTASRLSVVSDAKLTGNTKKSFKFFRKNAEFYGAFYINPTEDLVGGFWNTTSPELADRYARSSCMEKSNTPAACQKYAVVSPRSPSADQGDRLSQSGNLTFQAYRKRQTAGTFGAFATTENGDSGFSWKSSSEKEARAIALSRCEGDVKESDAELSALIRDRVMDHSKSRCRIAHVTSPGG